MNAETQDRREFIRQALRYPILAVLVALGGALSRRKGAVSASGRCRPIPLCGDCRWQALCDLPAASAVRIGPSRP